MQLAQRRIIVTGGARGIAAAAVRALVAEGALVASFDVLDDEGVALVDSVARTGPGVARYWHCDVASRASTDEAFEAAVEWLGGLDAMVNVAGVERGAPAEDIDDSHWDLMFEVNARGTLYTNQAAFRYMKEKGGRIINFASGAGVRGMRGGAAYSAAKGAVLAWTRTVAQEWGRYGITVNAVAPAIWTPMYDAHRARMSAEELALHDERMLDLVPIGGKLGDPDRDLAPVLVFLVGDGSRFITGQTLPVDGGRLILT
jgi:NAD(P)-dependent dehydrogenase (short-subunit alcohol dehydrogenase family)